MAEAEIIINEDDDLLRQITEEASPSPSSQEKGWLRPRGSAASVVPRVRYPVDDAKVFDHCQNCHSPLGGCIEGENAGTQWTLVMSCGHVLCQACKDECRTTRQERQGDTPLIECIICKEYGASNKLPGPENVNLGSCQAGYCKGEVWTLERDRCGTCQRNLCDGCVTEHEKRFPDHVLAPRGNTLVDPRRAFTCCTIPHSHPIVFQSHQPITARCDCGQMLCDRCPYNYTTQVPGTKRVQMHRKVPMEEIDLALEDALEDTIGTITRIRGMRSTAFQKKEELEELTDRMANEVALHFNQIIIQAIQRCFDVLTNLKKVGGKHHSAIDRHIKQLDKTERQLLVGVEMDERARCPEAVKAEKVSQYVRNVAYGLCKPAMEQFEDSKEFSSTLEATQFSLLIQTPDTRDIVKKIGRWGEHVITNAHDITQPARQVRIAPTRPVEAASIISGNPIKTMLTGDPIVAAEVPLRLHSALDHFTDLYERRFVSDSMLTLRHEEGYTRSLPFQLGKRIPPEMRLNGEEIEFRHSYERDMMSRPGMRIHGPNIFGGFSRIYNLNPCVDMVQKEVQAVYGRTPCLAPIWMADGEDPTEITPRRGTSEELSDTEPTDLRQALQREAARSASAARTDSASPSLNESRPATPHSAAAAAEREGSSPDVVEQRQQQQSSPLSSLQQSQQQPQKTVLRNKHLVFVKKDVLQPPTLQPEVTIPTTRPQTQSIQPVYGSPAPSRLLGPTILRRPAPPAPGSGLHFRPATTADFATSGVAPPPAAAAAPVMPHKPQVLLRDSAASSQLSPRQRLVRLFPSPKVGGGMSLTEGRPRFVRDTVRAFRPGGPSSSYSSSMMSGRSGTTLHPPRGHPGYFIPGGAGTTADRSFKNEMEDGGNDGMERSTIRVNTLRVMGNPANRYANMSMFKPGTVIQPRRSDTPEEAARRKTMHNQGFGDKEIDRVLNKARDMGALSQFRVVVPSTRGRAEYSVNSNHHRGPMGATTHSRYGDVVGAQMKKKMLPIERAFTSMFGADGKQMPFAFRRRGRPSKDDPTAPSNIIEQFRKNTTQWPPKFDEMTDSDIADLQELIDQLDDAARQESEERAEREEGDWPLFERGVKSEEEDPSQVSPWLQISKQEREKIKAVATERIQAGAKSATGGCFVCSLFRKEGKPRNWQCNECHAIGRELTPIRDDEIVEPPSKKPMYEIRPHSADEIEDIEDEEEQEEEEEGVDPLTTLFRREEEQPVVVEKRVERRGRPRKNKEPVEPPQPPTPKIAKPSETTPKQPRKRREPIAEEAEPEEGGVVMGTTRRGRQIKMPSKLKGHEVTTASTTRRSPSEAEEAMHPESSSAPVSAPPAAPATPRISPSKKKVTEMLREIKEETPERPPRSEMDGPKRGGRRRH